MTILDGELVKRVLILNDRQAYSDLVRKYQVEVRSYLTRLTRNREWANDLAQETFLLGYRKLDQLKDHDKYRAWIYSIAHSQFLQWHRSHKESESEKEPATIDTRDLFAGTEVRQLLKSLRPEECSALTLCLGYDFTHSEAASLLNLPLGTIKSLILRAREKIGAPS